LGLGFRQTPARIRRGVRGCNACLEMPEIAALRDATTPHPTTVLHRPAARHVHSRPDSSGLKSLRSCLAATSLGNPSRIRPSSWSLKAGQVRGRYQSRQSKSHQLFSRGASAQSLPHACHQRPRTTHPFAGSRRDLQERDGFCGQLASLPSPESV
jgi:hypothetical protein